MGYFSDMAIGGTVGEHREDRQLDRQLDRADDIAKPPCGRCRSTLYWQPLVDGQCAVCAGELRRRAENREGIVLGEQRATEAAAARGIALGSRVQRKGGGLAGTVISLYSTCSHERAYLHQGREAHGCQYKPRPMAGIEWDLDHAGRYRGRRFNQAVTVMRLSQIVPAEAAS